MRRCVHARVRRLRARLRATRRAEGRERAVERGAGQLARGEGAHHVRLCALLVTCVAGIFPIFN